MAGQRLGEVLGVDLQRARPARSSSPVTAAAIRPVALLESNGYAVRASPAAPRSSVPPR
ncbi:MAG: hypothetical protein IPL93_12225 [Actinomycetales bacterium]|nr:hypothetical protein [Actinomycetales bacterium]